MYLSRVELKRRIAEQGITGVDRRDKQAMHDALVVIGADAGPTPPPTGVGALP